LVVDFSGCGFLGSSGLAALVEARERSQATGVTLVLTGLNRVLTRALDATGLSGMFTVTPTLDDALTKLAV
jgi:anti-sigma B factor antagonist